MFMSTPQPVTSMTGYAQSEGQHDALSWRLELKSVNSKGFDLRLRLPFGFEAFDGPARAMVAGAVKRGAVNLSLTVDTAAQAQGARINRALLDDVLALAKELSPDGIKLEHVLAVRGVIETEDTTTELTPELHKLLEQALADTLARLVKARITEGAHLAKVLSEHLGHIATLTAQARTLAAAQPTSLRDKLTARLTELGHTALTPERIAQEAALLATRADISEELNRLEGHVKAVRDLLATGGPIGRKLDFLCQELNREANTLCSKSESLALTNVGVDLKVVIEQFREQVQNVE